MPKNPRLHTYDPTVFPRRLKRRRVQQGYGTQGDLAHALGISIQSENFYESGARQPKINTLHEIARVLNCSADWLIGLTNVSAPDCDYLAQITGLSDDAISTIVGYHDSIDGEKKMRMVNLLIENDILAIIARCLLSLPEAKASKVPMPDEYAEFRFYLRMQALYREIREALTKEKTP